MPGDPGLAAVARAGLERAQSRGLIGPSDLDTQIRHAGGFVGVLLSDDGGGPRPGELVVDLGSGGGLPGLVVGALLPQVRIALVEGSTGRAAFLAEVVRSCGWEDRVVVVGERAEVAGRDPRWRGTASSVVARGFGGPAETAECAAGVLRVGGLLVVSEPPRSDGSRWDRRGLSRLGMAFERVALVEGSGFAVMRQVEGCPEMFPRRVGVPRKRPLF